MSTEQSAAKKVVAFIPDLMDRSRFPRGADVTFVRLVQDLPAESKDADIVIADLNRPGSLEALCEVNSQIRRIGFTNHENIVVLEAANALGVEGMPRSKFFARIAQIVLQQ